MDNRSLRRPAGAAQEHNGQLQRYHRPMIHGAHILLYSRDPEADRAFFRDVLELRSVDAGHGWLIFALPPAEAALHPADGSSVQPHAEHDLLGAVLYFMCDDLAGYIGSLAAKGVRCSPVAAAPWGTTTTVRLPSGGEIGLYQPAHPTALDLDRR
jgi:catechol 2,3-dioxygenase-like lactoylglutathione lyase family enzyme